MIPIKANKAAFADLPFSVARLSDYNVPYFAVPTPYNQLIPYVSNMVATNMPLYFGQQNKAYVLFKTSIATALVCRIGDTDLTISDEIALTHFKTVTSAGVNWKYYYGEINLSNFGSTYTDMLYELKIYSGTSIVAKCPMRPICIGEEEKTLNFNFWNFNGNVAGFPFKDFDPTEAGTFGAKGLTYFIDGGIHIGATKNAIDQTSFRDQRYNPNTLSANPRKTATITVGGNKGVPEYVGEEINNILCCDTIFLNGMRIVRSGDSVPEPNLIAKSYPFVNFTFDVEIIKTEPSVYDVPTFLDTL